MAKPFVKWAGGKTQLLEKLLCLIEGSFSAYKESFVGGGALFFALQERGLLKGKKVVLNDLNSELIRAYLAIQNKPEQLIIRLSAYENTEEMFYETRDQNTDELSDLAIAARLIYLNRTCFNGLYRVNKRAGKFNAPFGYYNNIDLVRHKLIRECSLALDNVTLTSVDFRQDVPIKNGVYYFDPPYLPLVNTPSFKAYTRDGFTIKDHEDLAALALLRAKSNLVIVSGSDTPETRTIYAGLNLFEVQARRNINSNGKRRGPIGELIMTNASRRDLCDTEIE